MTPTRLSYRVTSGLPPVFRGCELDTDTLPQPDAEQLVSLLDASRLLTGVVIPHIVGCDTLKYAFEVDHGGKQVRMRFDQMQIWPELRPLIEFLERHARDLSEST